MINENELISRVLHEEEQAQAMAAQLAEAAGRGDMAELSATADRLRGVLDRELEAHLAMEEMDLFPVLAKRGLAPEVAVAVQQHTELRRRRHDLSQIPPGDGAGLRRCFRQLADDLQRHIRFEADFLYVDLYRREADAFRADVDGALSTMKET
jgi:hypothetical protein